MGNQSMENEQEAGKSFANRKSKSLLRSAHHPDRHATAEKAKSSDSLPVNAAVRWRGLYRWAGLVLILLVALFMLRLTWLTWPDPIVDFGRELYVPWRMLNGQTLYTQIAYHNGPFSPYLNAICFAISGVSLMSVVRLNLIVLVGVLWLLYLLIKEVADRIAATIGCITFVVLFAFGHFVAIGNYNWVCPYSHEITHGIALSLLAIYFVGRYIRSGALWSAAASGLSVGFVFLTKVDVFLAGSVASAVGMVLAVWAGGLGGRAAARPLGVWVGCAFIPAVTCAMLLSLAMPPGDAVHGVLGSCAHFIDMRGIDIPFFRNVSGTYDTVGNAIRLLSVTAYYVIALAPAALVALRLRASDRVRLMGATIVGVSYGLGFLLARRYFPWEDWLRPLPLLMFLLFIAGLIEFFRRRKEREVARRQLMWLMMICFGGLMLLKMILNVHVWHYGFGQAMMGTILLFVALVNWLPRIIDRWKGHGQTFAISVMALWIGILIGHLVVVNNFVSIKKHTVGEGPDAFRADWRGFLLNKAIEGINAYVGPDQTLTTFIDCEMLNYLTRRRNPIPYGNFNPHQVVIFGEGNIIEALEKSPPDYAAIVHADTREYGVRFFGRDFALDLWEWIQTHYRQVGQAIGAQPMQSDNFGIALMERRQPHSP
jgi:hypothetical protein